jgi:hypothetical protein
VSYYYNGAEYTIDREGREVRVRKPELRMPSQSEIDYYDSLEECQEDPYQLYPHCPYNLGTRLIHVKNSLWKCGACGNHFTVSKKSYV